MNFQKIKDKIDNDPDFINIKRFDYSLKKLLDRYPDGVPDRIIAQALAMEPEEINKLFENILVKLREKIGVNEV